MHSNGGARRARWWLTAVGGMAVGGAAALSGAFHTPATAQDKAKPADPAAKKADDKPAFDPKDVRVGAPPELAALRQAVEDAAKKGENVEEVRGKLEALEKALAGKPWLRPKPEPDPAPGLPRAVPPGFGGLPLDGADDLRKLMDELQRNPNDPQALLRLLGGMPNAGGGAWMFGQPGANPFDPFAVPRGGRAGGDGRFGIAMDAVPPTLREQLDLPADRGVVVAQVRPGSPADKAGVKVHDVIVEFAGKPVAADMRAFAQAVNDAKAGEKFDLTVLRKGKKETLKGVELPEPKARERGALRREFGPDFGGFGRGAAGGAMQLRMTDDGFTLKATRDGVEYAIDGTRDGGQLTPTKIVITDGDKTHTADKPDAVPEAYRDAVKALLTQVGGRRRVD